MKENRIQISFLITHYNRPYDLLQCIKAIKSLTISNSEIIVSDDGSIQENLKILKEYEIDKLVVSKTNKGLAANINSGILACSGDYLIYCQEDFLLHSEITEIMTECLELLSEERVDMVRFSSNVHFNKLKPISSSISLIPKLSIKNFFSNYYQYSDHPYITTKKFHDSFGYYLENTSGRYGETEYAIRILKSKARIAITNKRFASEIVGSKSVLINESINEVKKYRLNKKWLKIARAFRLYLELILYNNNRRGLITYKNFRDK